jgi:membrane protein DedA with SNARE-associated domain/rhodanese-related sulfurtransferase
MSGSMLQLLNEYGIWLVFVNVLIVQLGLPIPAVPTLVIAGAVAASGRIDLITVVAASVVASTLADYCWYLVGRRFGYRVLARLCRLSLAPDLCVRQAETNYQRWGASLLIFAKFIPGVATVAPPLAGVVHMGQRAFLLFAAVGGLLWAGTFVATGYVLNSQLGMMLGLFGRLGHYVTLAIALSLTVYILYRLGQRKRLLKTFEMTRIHAEDVRSLFLAPRKPVLIDVRSAVARRLDGRRVPGAIPFDVSELDRVVSVIPRDAHLIVFCACPNEVSAAYMASQLTGRGYRHVSPLKNGIDGWVDAGLPVERDEASKSISDGVLALVQEALDGSGRRRCLPDLRQARVGMS